MNHQILLRLITGAFLAGYSWNQVDSGWGAVGASLMDRMPENERVAGLFNSVMQGIFGSNPELAGQILFGGWMIAGIAIILGLYTRLAAGAGLLLTAIILEMLGYNQISANNFSVLLILCAGLLFANGGREYSLSSIIAARSSSAGNNGENM